MPVTSWFNSGYCENYSYGSGISWEADELTPLGGFETSLNDSLYAKAYFASDQVSDPLMCYSFGITSDDIPVGSIIQGFEVNILRHQNGNRVENTLITPIRYGVISGNSFQDDIVWETTDAYRIYGDSSWLGDISWTTYDLFDSSFGMAIQLHSIFSHAIPTDYTYFINHVQLRVYYAENTFSSTKSDFISYFL